MAPAKKTVWVSAGGHKHRVDTASGATPCGLRFREPWPACARSDPICKACAQAAR